MNLNGNKYKNFVTFNDLQCSINKIIVCLFERHKLSPRPNTIILIKVMSVTSDKHSEQDNEQNCFVIYTLLQTLRHCKLHCIPWITWSRSTDTMCLQYKLWVFWVGFPVNLVNTTLVCLDRLFVTCSYRNSAVFVMTSGTEQLQCSNSGETFCATFAVSRTDSIALGVKIIANKSESDESSWLATAEIFKLSFNIITLIYNHILPSEFHTKFCS